MNGVFRWLNENKVFARVLPWVLASLGAYLSWWTVNSSWIGLGTSLDALQKSAIVTAGFIVASFNLRFKLFDVITSDLYSAAEMRAMGVVYREARRSIESSLYVFLFTAVFMSIAPFAKAAPFDIPQVTMCLGWGLFFGSGACYIRILASLRSMEDGVLHRKTELKRQTEVREFMETTASYSDP